MKLWLLKPNESLYRRREGNPWTPWYNTCVGFVIRAESEADAREFAHTWAGNENDESKEPWRNPKYSDCEELITQGKAGLVLQDRHDG